MINNYKKSYLIINIILFITFIIFNVNFFILKNDSYYFSLFFLLIPFLIIFLIYGYEKKKKRFTYELSFSTFTYCIIYLLITYLIGIKVGFNSSIYKLNFVTLYKNIIPYLLIIIISEMFRYEISRKGEKSFLANTLITLILIVVDCTLFMNSFDLTNGDGKIRYFFYIILPSISKNLLLVHFALIGGLRPTIIYRVIMDLKMFILPIFPDFGYYFNSILSVCFPAFLGFISYSGLEKYKNQKISARYIKSNKFLSYLSVTGVTLIVLMMITLASGKFKYGMLSIGSGSMTGTINKGDVVIYENKSDKMNPKVGDILLFKKEKKIVVHRIIRKVKVNDEVIYYTKGDANKKEDGYPITNNDVIGIAKKRIKYLGIPSVALNELTQK